MAQDEDLQVLRAIVRASAGEGCTDDFLSRYVLNRLATQYLIPLIDTGVEIEAPDGDLRSIAGRVNVVRPGPSCLEALGMTSEEAATAELRNRRRPGYVPEDPSAAVMPGNMLIAGAAVLEFLKLVHGLFEGSAPDRYWAYSARSGELRACQASGGACSCTAWAARGDAGPPPLLSPHVGTNVGARRELRKLGIRLGATTIRTIL